MFGLLSLSMLPSLARLVLTAQKEFTKVARLTAMGFLAVGLIGFLVKVIFIPINQVRLGSSGASLVSHLSG